MRRRLVRMPGRLPRVGERPAGAEMGDDLVMLVLSLAAGDLGCKVRRGVEVALMGLDRALVLALVVTPATLVRTKDEGFFRKSLDGVAALEPLLRLAKRRGSTFSESSVSRSSALRLPAALEGATPARKSARSTFFQSQLSTRPLTKLGIPGLAPARRRIERCCI